MGAPLLDTVERFEEAHLRRRPEWLRPCLHDDAVIESVASHHAPLGPDETVQAITDALADGVYSLRGFEHELVETGLVVSTFAARHITPEVTMRDESLAALVVGRHGLMWRVTLFRTRDDALAAAGELAYAA